VRCWWAFNCEDCAGGDGDGVFRVEVWGFVEEVRAIGQRVVVVVSSVILWILGFGF
jgi:hypothetical protein